MKPGYRIVRGSDVQRDAMFLELIDDSTGDELAEVFYSDEPHKMTVSLSQPELPLPVIELLIAKAKHDLPPTAILQSIELFARRRSAARTDLYCDNHFGGSLDPGTLPGDAQFPNESSEQSCRGCGAKQIDVTANPPLERVFKAWRNGFAPGFCLRSEAIIGTLGPAT